MRNNFNTCSNSQSTTVNSKYLPTEKMSSLAEETVINLLDSHWFQYRIFTPKPTTPNLDQTLQEQQEEQNRAPVEKPKLNPMKKSFSDQFLSSKDCSNSPNSVLAPQLQTILSGKEFEQNSPVFSSTPKKQSIDTQKRKKRRNCSKSLSELEFEEVKGFMDLGFEFSDDDTCSKLVSIIPGLKRVGKKHVEESNKGLFGDKVLSVSRPYLSEAWDCLEKKEKKGMSHSLMDLKIIDLGNEMEFKDHLRIWARTVASTVR